MASADEADGSNGAPRSRMASEMADGVTAPLRVTASASPDARAFCVPG